MAIKTKIPYGNDFMDLELPENQIVGISYPKSMPALADQKQLLDDSIAAGIENTNLANKAKPGAKACIVITDRTRSTPNRLILPILLDHLNRFGIPDSQITVISGGGMHSADSQNDLIALLGEKLISRVEVITNQPDNDDLMVRVGRTKIGTPVEIHQRFNDADIKLGITNVNPCMLAGWSGSGKIVMPGISSRRGIYHNHKYFVRPLLELGVASLMGIMPPENPVRADIEDCATVSGIDMVVNTVLDSNRELVNVFCGQHIPAHRSAVDFMKPYVEVSLPQKVDIMIGGVGDPALEVSLFQGGSRVCGGVDRYLNPGGTLIMSNTCTEGIYEGFEHEEFRQWMQEMPTPAEIGQLVEQEKMGGEKGCVLFTFSWLIHEMNCRIIVVTAGMTAEELEAVHLGHGSQIQKSFNRAVSDYDQPSIGVMPYAGLVLPALTG
jgi:nickel-dependent lactate racemase